MSHNFTSQVRSFLPLSLAHTPISPHPGLLEESEARRMNGKEEQNEKAFVFLFSSICVYNNLSINQS